MPASKTKPPGPRGLPLVGTSYMAQRDPMATLTRWAQQYGDIVHYRFFGLPVYLLFHPLHIEQILMGKTEDFEKGMFARMNSELFGNGLLTSDGEFWRRQRRLSSPAFHRESIVRYAEITVEETVLMLAGWRKGEAHNIHNDMMNVTLRVVLRSLFGGELGERTSVIEHALNVIMRGSYGIQVATRYWRIPSLTRTRYLRAVRQLDAVVYELISRGRKKINEDPRGANKDLLTLLLLARDEDGSMMTDQQLRDEIIAFLLAGHETTALTLSWTWYLLAQHPVAEERLHKELDAALGGRLPKAGDLAKLPYADSVIREALRLYPPAWRIGRRANKPLQVGDYILPQGANILMSQWVTHRDERWFSDPGNFNPDRWRAESMANLPRLAYFPFGGGPRVCIGAGFAMMEATLLLAVIAQRFRMLLVPGQRVKPLPSITLRPKNGIHVQLEERAAAREDCNGSFNSGC
jgi:cytochrome P450